MYAYLSTSQSDCHPLWNVHLWVSESPSSHITLPFESGVHCSQPPRRSLGNHGTCYTVPAWDPVSRSELPSSVGSKPLVGPVFPGPTSTPVHTGNRARSPEHPYTKKPEGESLYQALKSHIKSPQYQESDFSMYPLEKQKCAAQHSQSQFSFKHFSCVCAWPGGFPQVHQLCGCLL